MTTEVRFSGARTPVATRFVLPAFAAAVVATRPAWTDLCADQLFTVISARSLIEVNWYGSLTAQVTGGATDVGYVELLVDDALEICGGESGGTAGAFVTPMGGKGPFFFSGINAGPHHVRARASSANGGVTFGVSGSMPAGWGSIWVVEHF